MVNHSKINFIYIYFIIVGQEVTCDKSKCARLLGESFTTNLHLTSKATRACLDPRDFQTKLFNYLQQFIKIYLPAVFIVSYDDITVDKQI